jgi:hypothetical protein
VLEEPVPALDDRLGEPGGPRDAAYADSTENHREAMHARRVARLAYRRADGVVRFEDVDLVALASLDMALAARFVRAHLGPLAAQDDDKLRLSATLRVYLEEQPAHGVRLLGSGSTSTPSRPACGRSGSCCRIPASNVRRSYSWRCASRASPSAPPCGRRREEAALFTS